MASWHKVVNGMSAFAWPSPDQKTWTAQGKPLLMNRLKIQAYTSSFWYLRFPQQSFEYSCCSNGLYLDMAVGAPCVKPHCEKLWWRQSTWIKCAHILTKLQTETWWTWSNQMDQQIQLCISRVNTTQSCQHEQTKMHVHCLATSLDLKQA